MTTPIQPVRIPGVSSTGQSAGVGALKTAQTDDSDFAKAVADALASVSRMDNAVTQAAEAAAVGDLESVSDYMVAATEAQLATEITVAVRDRAISAFNDIMRMQI